MIARLTHYTAQDIGRCTLASTGYALIGCWFDGAQHFGDGIESHSFRNDDDPILKAAISWLDRYFKGYEPHPEDLPLHPAPTPFQQAVRTALLEIPYGQTTTYGALALRVEQITGSPSSPRAIGGAVGRNRVSIIVPCHRVIGASGKLTGFAAGIDIKAKLLIHEGALK